VPRTEGEGAIRDLGTNRETARAAAVERLHQRKGGQLPQRLKLGDDRLLAAQAHPTSSVSCDPGNHGKHQLGVEQAETMNLKATVVVDPPTILRARNYKRLNK